MMIRITSFLIAWVLLTAPVFAQVPPGPGPSFFYSGQPQIGVANTTTPTTILTVPITAGYTTPGVHCRILGIVSTAPIPGSFNLAAQWGLSAPFSFLTTSQLGGNLASAPLMVDIYLQNTSGVNSLILNQELQTYTTIPIGAVSSFTVYSRQLQQQVNSGTLTLSVSATWGTASALNQYEMQAANCSVGS